MIRLTVWHDTNLGDFVYPDGYKDEYIFNSEIREEPPVIVREVAIQDGHEKVQNMVVTSMKSFLLYVEEPLQHLMNIIPMYKYIQVYDETLDISYTEIYNITLSDQDSYNNNTVKAMKLTFAYKNYITRNSA